MRNVSVLVAVLAAAILLAVAWMVSMGAPSSAFLWGGLLVAALVAGIAIGVTRHRRGERLAHRPGGP